MKEIYSKVTHIIFDLDGLILDTEKSYEKAIQQVAAEYGKVYTHETKMKLMGTTETDTSNIAVREMNLPITPEEFLQKYKNVWKKMLVNAPLLPGAAKLINHFHKHNIPIALATSSSKESVAIKMASYKEIAEKFHHMVMASTDPEVKQGKPKPDIFLICASRFDDKPKPEKCLVLEDAPNGVQAALSAGMQVIWVPDPKTDRSLGQNATVILDSLEQFKPELFGLPPLET